jgi:hypothetical protein
MGIKYVDMRINEERDNKNFMGVERVSAQFSKYRCVGN